MSTSALSVTNTNEKPIVIDVLHPAMRAFPISHHCRLFRWTAAPDALEAFRFDQGGANAYAFKQRQSLIDTITGK
jgi:hypothetical protein